MPAAPKVVLSIRDLVVEFPLVHGVLRAVDGVSYDVAEGQTLAVVGETGSGKSATVLAAVGLLAGGGRVVGGAVSIDGTDFLALSERERRRRLGRTVSIVFQDPSAALNPVMTVGAQLSEALAMHNPAWGRKRRRERAVALLSDVGVPQADLRYGQYPHQFSGGMAQRVMIAIAIANQPRVLIADEPTTAVDVTIQAQLLQLLKQAQVETGAATVLITHDLGVVAEVADEVAVMYAGRVVERGSVRDVFARPAHPYTVALLKSLPRLDVETEFLDAIPGAPPDMRVLPPGCTFEPRCFLAGGRKACIATRPALARVSGDHASACHFRAELASPPARLPAAALP